MKKVDGVEFGIEDIVGCDDEIKDKDVLLIKKVKLKIRADLYKHFQAKSKIKDESLNKFLSEVLEQALDDKMVNDMIEEDKDLMLDLAKLEKKEKGEDYDAL